MKLRFLQNYKFDHFRKRRNWNFGTLGLVSIKKISFSFLHWISDGLEMPGLCVRWVQFDFGTRVSPNQLAWFLLPKSKSKAYYLFWNFPSETKNFSVQWYFDETKMPENANRFDMPRYWNLYFSTCFVFFHQVVNPYPITWGGLFVFKNHEDIFLHRSGVLMD